MDNTAHLRGELLEMSSSYWKACTLHTGTKLDLFTLIGEDSLGAESIAEKTGCSLRGISPLLDALAAMELLVKKGESYQNTPLSKSCLIKTSADYLGHIILHHHHLMGAWHRLDQAVQSGKSLRTGPPSDPERESFLMGMFNMAMGIAPHLVKEIELKGRHHLLDLGGGPGTYAIHFCMANPGLQATVFDLPTTRPFAMEILARFRLENRITFQEGDYLKDRIQGSYDVAWLSHIFHGEGPEACLRMLEKTVEAMEKGGLLLVHEFVLEDTRDRPVFPALFSLNMLVNTQEGMAYSEGQIREMLTRAGLSNIRRLPFVGPNQSAIICGER